MTDHTLQNPVVQHLRLRDVTVIFPNESEPTLSAVNLDAVPGDLVCVYGASGAGKSTLLTIIAGLRAPTSGTVDVVDADGSSRQLSRDRSGIGVSFQTPLLFPELTPQENVEAGQRVPDSVLAAGVLARSGVAGLRVATCSGGEAKRMDLCRLFASRPAIAVLDEPFSGLDEDRKQWCRDEVEVLRDAGTIVVVSAHDRDEWGHASQFVHLSEGGCDA